MGDATIGLQGRASAESTASVGNKNRSAATKQRLDHEPHIHSDLSEPQNFKSGLNLRPKPTAAAV
jgi:hypothetical protein